jgi:hypothetical protein
MGVHDADDSPTHDADPWMHQGETGADNDQQYQQRSAHLQTLDFRPATLTLGEHGSVR